MSRRAGYPVVVTEGADGTPIDIRRTDGEKLFPHRHLPSHVAIPVLHILAYHREWIGVLDGEPERDVWLVETPDGICELHRLRDPARAATEGAQLVTFDAAPAAHEGASDSSAITAPLPSPTFPPDRWILARWMD